MAKENARDIVFGRVLRQLRRLESIMRREGEDNWIHGICSLISAMEHGAPNLAGQQDILKSVRASYRTMMGAKDGFGDYVVWRDDFQARLQANRELDTLRTEVWQLLNGSVVE